MTEFKFRVGEWSSLPSLPQPNHAGASCVLEPRHLYYFGGSPAEKGVCYLDLMDGGLKWRAFKVEGIKFSGLNCYSAEALDQKRLVFFGSANGKHTIVLRRVGEELAVECHLKACIDHNAGNKNSSSRVFNKTVYAFPSDNYSDVF